MSVDPHELKPYRIEWRPFLTTRWVLLSSYASHDEALAALDDPPPQHPRSGQHRIVVQHVIEARGLGANGGPA